MRCPSLNDLPPPPLGKTGWPWTVESDPLLPTMPDGQPWPKISIVTPSYNQGEFIEETIRSILLQNYPNLEYIIIDGGSADASVEIIRKYEPWLTYWLSEKDRGQSHALMKGFRRATGTLFAWLNSDDYYLTNTLSTVALSCNKHPDAAVYYGDFYKLLTEEEQVGGSSAHLLLPRDVSTVTLDLLRRRCGIGQQSCFFNSKDFFATDCIDEDLHYAMDYDLWFRLFSLDKKHVKIDNYLSVFRYHKESKTCSVSIPFSREELLLMWRYRSPFFESKFFSLCRALSNTYHIETRAELQSKINECFSASVFAELRSVLRNSRNNKISSLACSEVIFEKAITKANEMDWRCARKLIIKYLSFAPNCRLSKSRLLALLNIFLSKTVSTT